MATVRIGCQSLGQSISNTSWKFEENWSTNCKSAAYNQMPLVKRHLCAAAPVPKELMCVTSTPPQNLFFVLLKPRNKIKITFDRNSCVWCLVCKCCAVCMCRSLHRQSDPYWTHQWSLQMSFQMLHFQRLRLLLWINICLSLHRFQIL